MALLTQVWNTYCKTEGAQGNQEEKYTHGKIITKVILKVIR